MQDREAELKEQIAGVIKRLQEIQKSIGGSRQPASRIELETLEELGRSYEALNRELQAFVRRG